MVLKYPTTFHATFFVQFLSQSVIQLTEPLENNPDLNEIHLDYLLRHHQLVALFQILTPTSKWLFLFTSYSVKTGNWPRSQYRPVCCY